MLGRAPALLLYSDYRSMEFIMLETGAEKEKDGPYLMNYLSIPNYLLILLSTRVVSFLYPLFAFFHFASVSAKEKSFAVYEYYFYLSIYEVSSIL